ncbi:hypothetical protein QTI66_01500 [Variovorax sp. J22R133]|uniref:hypothetical protein n=1 Tax=Variovorax brevis TaxID=3053503 RepID=UPI0025779C36|nr:hypothetical protein [Variovorax sp. J22R133]MDM0110801.1 hypothetical protein [Variovorax sp. J22R133]
MNPERSPVQTVRTPGVSVSPTVAPRPSLEDLARLSVYLPAKLNGHDNASSFLEEVARAALEARETCSRLAPKEVRGALGELAGAASAFRTALGVLREPEIEKRLRLHLDASAELVDRLRADMDALMSGCESAVKSLEGPSATQPGTQAARGLVVRVAMAHLRCFKSLPAQHSWFGSAFMPNLGRMIGITVDSDVVVEMLELLEQET